MSSNFVARFWRAPAVGMTIARALAHVVVPQENGATVADKVLIGTRVAHNLMAKIDEDLKLAAVEGAGPASTTPAGRRCCATTGSTWASPWTCRTPTAASSTWSPATA